MGGGRCIVLQYYSVLPYQLPMWEFTNHFIPVYCMGIYNFIFKLYIVNE